MGEYRWAVVREACRVVTDRRAGQAQQGKYQSKHSQHEVELVADDVLSSPHGVQSFPSVYVPTAQTVQK